MIRKRFGQHFLEPVWADKVIDVIAPGPEDRFIEIGPGQGALTTRLTGRVAHLTAIEVDRDLAARLRATAPRNLDVIEGDFLQADVATLISNLPAATDSPARVRVAGNLPYNISSPIIFKLLKTARATHSIRDATIMLQREVADRLTGPVGTKDYGVLTILTSLYAEAERMLALPPGAFRPMPKVHSAVVRLTFRPPRVLLPDLDRFEQLVRSIFTQRRKMLGNALRPYAASLGRDAANTLRTAGIDPARRPETLDVSDLARLDAALHRA